MIIARKGKYTLRTKTFIEKHIFMTDDIDICCDCDEEGVTCYSIADFDRQDISVTSIGNRLLESIETTDDLENIKYLTDIGLKIVAADLTASGYSSTLNYEGLAANDFDYTVSDWEFK